MQVKMDKPFIIAYYLPQYHPIPENDEWWGKGFTEWTNVAKAKPLFKGHYQPKIPADLGFYDLRVPEVREQQAELAREAGVDGFCYWHYWFGNGKELLERPFKEVVESGKPDFPFCLGWANEDWQAKVWSQGNVHSIKNTLIQQEYPDKEDHIIHFQKYLKAFKDPRYIKINNKPIFLIYKPFNFPNVKDFLTLWNSLLVQTTSMEGFYFIGVIDNESDFDKLLNLGFSAANLNVNNRMSKPFSGKKGLIHSILGFIRELRKMPIVIKYSDSIKHLWNESFDKQEAFIPTLLPNWDHTPRSGKNALVIQGSTPSLFEKHCDDIFNGISQKKNKLVFLKSWNEWGEGNYMEPDFIWGKSFIHALAKSKNNSKK